MGVLVQQITLRLFKIYKVNLMANCVYYPNNVRYKVTFMLINYWLWICAQIYFDYMSTIWIISVLVKGSVNWIHKKKRFFLIEYSLHFALFFKRIIFLTCIFLLYSNSIKFHSVIYVQLQAKLVLRKYQIHQLLNFCPLRSPNFVSHGTLFNANVTTLVSTQIKIV